MSMFGLVTGLFRQKIKHGRRALRGKVTSKQGPRNFYKGRGARSLGVVTSKGVFRYVDRKLPNFVVPDLTGFDLKPYVAYGTPLVKTPLPSVPQLDLDNAEVDILDIVAPHHRKLREARRGAPSPARSIDNDVSDRLRAATTPEPAPEVDVVFRK